jgi:nucleotide-binding universal stress UspA family protein
MTESTFFERRCLVAPAGAAEAFDRVLCGVDGTPQSVEAVRQAARLRTPAGSLTVVSAADLGLAAHAGFAAAQAAATMRAETEEALEASQREVRDATFLSFDGRPTDVLLAQAKQLDATLVAVGSHGVRRPVGIAVGSVATTMLHEAPCSVLVARETAAEGEFPRSIVVGVDGSPESATATAVAFGLGERFGVEVWPVASTSGKGVDAEAVRKIATGVVFDERAPVDALVTATGGSDLLVVGSRGLHGVRALGSVSERVAHQAGCSVLVVRPPLAEREAR